MGWTRVWWARGWMGVVVAGVVMMMMGRVALGGAGEPPLEVRVDMADMVVVGKITVIVAESQNLGEGSRCGRATVAVEETIKGSVTKPAKEVRFMVVTGVDSRWQGAAVLRPHQVGDREVWVVKNDWLWDAGEISADRAEEVRGMVKALAERKWSAAVGGLRARTGVAKGAAGGDEVVFAVQNESKEAVYVPGEETKGFVRAAVTDGAGKVVAGALRPGEDAGRVWCVKLGPGEIRYMHPGSVCIDVKRGLGVGAGRYRVAVSCKNERAEGEVMENDQRKEVKAWVGELTGEEVGVELR